MNRVLKRVDSSPLSDYDIVISCDPDRIAFISFFSVYSMRFCSSLARVLYFSTMAINHSAYRKAIKLIVRAYDRQRASPTQRAKPVPCPLTAVSESSLEECSTVALGVIKLRVVLFKWNYPCKINDVKIDYTLSTERMKNCKNFIQEHRQYLNEASSRNLLERVLIIYLLLSVTIKK